MSNKPTYEELEQRIKDLDQDIAKYKQIEEELRESQFLFSEMFEQSTTSIQLFDPDGYCLSVNSEFCKMFGVHAEDIIDGKYNILKDLNLMSPRITKLVEGIFNEQRVNRWEGQYDIGISADLFGISTAKRKQIDIDTLGYPILDNLGQLKYVVFHTHDITERKQERVALRESEERFRFLAENMADIVWTLDLNFKTTYVSPSIKEILGFTPDERKQQTIEEMLTQESIQRAMALFQKEFQQDGEEDIDSDRSITLEVEYYHAEGNTIWMDNIMKALRDQNGEIIGIYGSSRDITERKLSEEALKQSENKFAKAFHTSPVVMGISDIETGEYIEVNQAFYDKLGFTSEEVIGKKSTDILRMDKEFRSRVISKMKKQGFIQNEEGVIYDKNGMPRTLLFSADIIELQNKKYNFSSALDITDRKLMEEALRTSEERYSSVVNNAIEAICVIQNGRFKYFNPEVKRLFGYSAEDLEQLTFEDTIHPEDREMVISIHVKRDIGEPVKSTHSYRIITKDGRIRWIEIKAVTITWSGQPATLVFLTDITERKQSEELIIQTEKMMSIGGLAAGMAHELNNPLGGILLGIQNIERRLLPDLKSNIKPAEEFGIDLNNLQLYMENRKIHSYINGIKKSGKKASQIILNMLQFSRKSESKMTQIDLEGLMVSVLDLAGKDYDLEKEFDFRNIRIIKEFEKDLPLVPCNETEIEQVMLNLLNNATWAMANEKTIAPPLIILRMKVETNMFRIEVEDSGPGMNEETRKRIFEPFFTTKPVGEGTGLGLSVSYMIITNNHKGTMEVESEIGNGAKFIIRLPME